HQHKALDTPLLCLSRVSQRSLRSLVPLCVVPLQEDVPEFPLVEFWARALWDQTLVLLEIQHPRADFHVLEFGGFEVECCWGEISRYYQPGPPPCGPQHAFACVVGPSWPLGFRSRRSLSVEGPG